MGKNNIYICEIIKPNIEKMKLEIVESMNKDSGITLKELQVSGGMTNNKLLMQIQADFLGIPVG